MILTNGETYGKEVFLSQNESADNWSEITEEKYNKIIETGEMEEGLKNE